MIKDFKKMDLTYKELLDNFTKEERANLLVDLTDYINQRLEETNIGNLMRIAGDLISIKESIE
jgi:hypothetical protein